MNLELATEIGIDIIAPAVTIFTIWYTFRPWRATHIGRAIWTHSLGSMLLFDLAALEQHGIVPEDALAGEFLLSLVILWIIGWWYMVFALWLTRDKDKRPAQ